ncbi:hypothetical protein [Nocardia sp. NPDC052566]
MSDPIISETARDDDKQLVIVATETTDVDPQELTALRPVGGLVFFTE